MNDEQFSSISLISTKQLCRELNVSARSIERWVSLGTFPKAVIRGKWRLADVEKWLDAKAKQLDAPKPKPPNPDKGGHDGKTH